MTTSVASETTRNRECGRTNGQSRREEPRVVRLADRALLVEGLEGLSRRAGARTLACAALRLALTTQRLPAPRAPAGARPAAASMLLELASPSSAPRRRPRRSPRPRASSSCVPRSTIRPSSSTIDAVAARGRGDAVGDEEHRALRGLPLDGLEDRRLGLRVDGGERVVQDEDLRLPHEGARERDALLLPARELHAALAHDGVEPLGQPERLLEHLRLARGVADALPAPRATSGSSSAKPMLRETVVEKRNASCCA